MKVSVSTYSFARLMGSNEITQFGCIAKAKEMGFDGIEFVDILPHDGSSVEEYAKKLRAECERVGLDITNFTFGADFINGSNGDTKAEIERVKKQIDIAEILGAKSVRHDSTNGKSGKSFDSLLPIVAEGCREVTKYAKTKGIKTMTENHGIFSQDSERVEKLINEVNDENFGWLCDMGNFLCVDENPAVAFGRAARYAFYAHAKDFYVKNGNEPNPGSGYFKSRGGNYLKGTIIGHGNVPVVQCLSILKNSGYDGYIAIEFEGMEDVLTGISVGLENLRKYIEMA